MQLSKDAQLVDCWIHGAVSDARFLKTDRFTVTFRSSSGDGRRIPDAVVRLLKILAAIERRLASAAP